MSSSTSIGVGLRVTGHSSQGGRKYMEDFFSVAYQQSADEKDLEYAFFGIYDGHGGSEAAMFAKEHLMFEIVNQKQFWSDCDQDVLRAIREGFIATHYAMWRTQEKWPKTATGLPSTAGTTATVAFIRKEKIYIGHVGDSGVVLGYQEPGENFWRAKPLTQDHKPECMVEKARIINSGGKVVSKSGVPRVVWNRPRIGHKGPVRRSTPFDEIPFLAVARSLGDLWSYNSANNQFVVSPDPDVSVVKIDPKTFRCLIFGTDGLWNVVNAKDAVDSVRDSETINDHLTAVRGVSNVWTNPSKRLVDNALDTWGAKRMRADNTSVVTVLLDPPNSSGTNMSNGLEYHEMEQNVDAYQMMAAEHAYSHHLYDDVLNSSHQPAGPLVNSTYSNLLDDSNSNSICDNSDYYYDGHSASSVAGVSTETVPYLNSFAESYNSLLSSSQMDQEASVGVGQFAGSSAEQIDYQKECMSAEEGYSLTKLETRGEQQLRLTSAVQTFQVFEPGLYNPMAEQHHQPQTYEYDEYSQHEVSYEEATWAPAPPPPEEEEESMEEEEKEDTIQIHEISSSSVEASPESPESPASPSSSATCQPPATFPNEPNENLSNSPKSATEQQKQEQAPKTSRRSVGALKISSDLCKRTLRSSNSLSKDLKATLTTTSTGLNLRSRQIWSAADDKLRASSKRKLAGSPSSAVSSSTPGKRSSIRNSAWCSAKTSVQTRNRVQKRFNNR